MPWRVKAFLSRHFPLAYHLVVNAGIKGNSQNYWDRMLEATWDDPKRSWPIRNALIESLTRPDQSILDLGCGNGSILRYLKQRGYSNLHGLEVSRIACDRLEASGISMHCGRLPRIPLPDASFDVVIASQVPEHVIRRRLFSSEIARVLKREGRTFIFVPNNCMGPIDEPEHGSCTTRHRSHFFWTVFSRSLRSPKFMMPIMRPHSCLPTVLVRSNRMHLLSSISTATARTFDADRSPRKSPLCG